MFHIDPMIPDRRYGTTTGRPFRTVETSDRAFCFISERACTGTRPTGPVAAAAAWKTLSWDTGTWTVVPPARYYSPRQIVQGLAERADGQVAEDPASESGALLVDVARAGPTSDRKEAWGEDEWDTDVWSSARFNVALAALTRLHSRSSDEGSKPDGIICVVVDPPYSGRRRNPNWATPPRQKIKLFAVPENCGLSRIQGSTWAMSGLGTKRLAAPAYSADISEIAIPVGPALTDGSPQELDYTRPVFDAVVVRSEDNLEPFIQLKGSVTSLPAPVLGSPTKRRVKNKRHGRTKEGATEPVQKVDRPPLLADVGKLIQGWTDLSDIKRRDLLSAVSAALRIDAIPDSKPKLNAVPRPATMSCAYLNTRLFRQAYALYGIKSSKRFANILSGLRFILGRLDGHERPFAVSMLSASWRTLHKALTDHRKLALQNFMRFCSARSIEPEAVTADTLAAFEAWLLERTFCRNAPVRGRAVASNWTWARASLPGWPDVELKRPRMRESYVLPFAAYPDALQADAKRFLDRLSFADAEDIFPDNVTEKSGGRAGLLRALRPRTIAARSFQLRQCLAAMVIMGRDPASISSLRQLVDPPEKAHAIIRFFLDRAGNRQTSQTGHIGEVLRQLAKYHCHLEPDVVDRIALWAKRASPKVQFAISQKNDERVRALLQPHATTALLGLPAKLMDEAAAPELCPHEAARLALYASVLATLFAFPMRRSNLAALRVDQHLLRLTSGGKLIDHIALPGSETKNAKDMLWEVPKAVGKILQIYLERYRPHLTTAGNPYLFPQKGMERRSAHDLAVGLKKLVEGRIGCAFNIHLVRHFVVALFLQDHPGHYDDARKLLGHAATSYTIAVYAPWDVARAVRSMHKTMTRAGFSPAVFPLPPQLPNQSALATRRA